MKLETDRLILRPWEEGDAQSLYEYAKDDAVGPAAGWPPHRSVAESLNVIQNVLTGPQCYAICEKRQLPGNRLCGAEAERPYGYDRKGQ